MASVALHVPFIKAVAASALGVAVHFAVPGGHVLAVDVMPTICLTDGLYLPTTDALKCTCIPYHVTETDVLTEHPI